MYDIVFVCTGNTCRSPMAAELLRKELAATALTVGSCGVAAGASPASRGAINAMKKEGLSLAAHMSRRADAGIICGARLVLCMTDSHFQYIKRAFAGVNVHTLCGFAGENGDISDPFGGDDKVYEMCAHQIKKLLIVAAKKIKEEYV